MDVKKDSLASDGNKVTGVPIAANQQYPNTEVSGNISLWVDKVEQLLMLGYFFVAVVLVFRFVLSLFGASQESQFVSFVYQITNPFMVPFLSMFGRNPSVGEFHLEFEVIVALLVYALVFVGLTRLIRIVFK